MSEHVQIAFVVLHYLTLDATRACIRSILDLDSDVDIRIVIVDNCSPNGSGELLREEYSDSEKVQVLINGENLGFSVGNNIGYAFACANWNPAAIIVLNNDVCVEQKDFLNKLICLIEKTDSYVISPDIFASKKNEHQSPLRLQVISQQEAQKQHDYLAAILSGIDPSPLKSRLKRLKVVRAALALRNRLRDRRRARERDRIWVEERADIVPHGAAVIFTDKFIATNERPFDPETHFYYEEDILALRCQRNGWKILYTPELQVIHHHALATKKAMGDDYEKEKFIARNYVRSLNVLLKMYRGDEG